MQLLDKLLQQTKKVERIIVSCYELLYVVFKKLYKDDIFLKDVIFIELLEDNQTYFFEKN